MNEPGMIPVEALGLSQIVYWEQWTAIKVRLSASQFVSLCQTNGASTCPKCSARIPYLTVIVEEPDGGLLEMSTPVNHRCANGAGA